MPRTAIEEHIDTITQNDQNYPALLAKIYGPPKQLYIRGTLPPADSLYFAVVGTRLMSPYGKQVTHEIVRELARAGVVVVSGLALGIDGEAHRAALEVNGRTIAVLGSGIDRASVYPPEHRGLADQIVESGGAVLSEYPPETTPTKYSFPERNRIIAGMSVGVLVVEAKEKSGALITAQFALDEGREVCAIPGPITGETSRGPNALIATGARLVTGAPDILELLGMKEAPRRTAPKLEPTETIIWNALSREPIHIDALVAATKLDIAALTSTLAIMEINGLVKNLGGMHFIRLV